MSQPDRRKSQPRRGRTRRPPAGASPGTLIVPTESDAPQVVEVLDYSPTAISSRNLPAGAVVQRAQDSGDVTWIHVRGLGNAAALQQLGRTFGIHRLALADIVNVPQRARFQVYDDSDVIIAKVPHSTGTGVDLQQVSLVVGKNYLLSFHECEQDVFDPVRQRLRENVGIIRTMGPDYLAYALLDAVVDSYYPFVDALTERIEQLESVITLQRSPPGMLAELHDTKRTIVALSIAIRRHRDLLTGFLRPEGRVSPAVRVYLRDVHDHAVELLESLESARDVTASLMELHLVLQNTRMNEVMKTLTIVTAVFIPLTFVTSIYGMNFDYMPELRHPLGYPIAIFAMVSMATLMVWQFRRRGWL